MSGRVELVSVDKSFAPDTQALADVCLTIEPGELVTVVGPSGCGKTTLLRTLAGLQRPDGGRVVIDGADQSGLAPAQRRVAMVFQTDTLFADLTVRANVEFGLGERAGAREAVDVALLRLGISALAERYPHELSGGQQRRVALARALVLRPAVLLLDEPLSGLDEALRASTLALVADTQRRFQLTTVYVTHAIDEALSLGDRVVVLNGGRIEQVGAPREVYRRPASVFVAQFVGRSNLLDATVTAAEPGARRVRLLGADLRLPAHPSAAGPGGAVVVLLRPRALALRATSRPSRAEVRGRHGIITHVRYFGSRLDYVVESEHGMLTIAGDPIADPLPVGEWVEIEVDEHQGWVLPVA